MGGSAGSDEGLEASPAPADRVPAEVMRPVSRKVIAVAIVVVLVAAAVGVIWYVCLRHWSIEDVAAQMIFDPDENSPGYKHSLAGKSVTVEGRVTGFSNISSNLGPMTLVEVDDFDEIKLLYWEQVSFVLGDRIEKKVSFEWSTFNDETHVYSPDLSFPVFGMYAMEWVIYGVYFTQTFGGTVEISNQGADVKTMVTFLREPIPLDCVNCTLRSGSGSFLGEYLDLMGRYMRNNVTDRIASLQTPTSVNGTVEFSDSNSDSYLDNGDYFVFKNITRPEERSGLRTYLMTLEWWGEPADDEEDNQASIYYWVTCDGAVLFSADTPMARLHRSSDGLAERVTFDFIDRPLTWDDVVILLVSDSIIPSNGHWYPEATDLTGTAPRTMVYPSQAVGSTNVVLTCTDVQGDGIIQEGDFFTFDAADGLGFPEGVRYELRIPYEGTYSEMAVPIGFARGSEPKSTLSVDGLGASIVGEFSTVYNETDGDSVLFDVCWDELQFVLSNGTAGASLLPPEGFLSGIPGSPVTLGMFSLGDLSVVCNVTDLNGDGMVNRGDRVTLVAIDAERFLSSETYSLSVVYLPESSVMCSVTFSG